MGGVGVGNANVGGGAVVATADSYCGAAANSPIGLRRHGTTDTVRRVLMGPEGIPSQLCELVRV